MKLQDHARGLREILAPLKFSLESSTWRRDDGEFIDVIEFVRMHGDIAVNVGVLTKSVYEIAWGEAPPPRPSQAQCTVHAPHLTGFFERGQYWKIDDPSAATQIGAHVRNLVLPFFDRMRSREEQIRYLRERQKSKPHAEWSMPIYEGILMYQCGEQAEACTLLSKQKWPQRLPQILSQLNCPQS